MMQGKDSGSQRDHLTVAAKRGSVRAQQELDAHPCPPALAYLLRLFERIAPWRGSTGMGPAPLTLADVREAEARFGFRLLPGELSILKRLDFAALKAD